MLKELHIFMDGTGNFFLEKKRIKTQKLKLCIKLQSNFNQRRETKIKANLLILCLYSLKIN